MTLNDKIRNDKLQHDISKEAASGKIYKFEYLTGKKAITI